MLGLGWGEMLVLATIAILVVGPKDLPKMLRSLGRTIKGVRSMAGDFQRQFNDAIEDIDDDGNMRSAMSPMKGIKNEMKSVKEDFDLSWMDTGKPDKSAESAAAKPDDRSATKPASKPKAKTTRKPAGTAKAKVSAAKKPAAVKKPAAAKKPASAKKPAAAKKPSAASKSAATPPAASKTTEPRARAASTPSARATSTKGKTA